MSLSANSLASWNDIQAIYTNLKTEYTRFNVVWTDPSNQQNSPVKSTSSSGDPYDLKTKIEALNSVSYVKNGTGDQGASLGANVASTNITPPNSGTPISASLFTSMNDTISKISQVCAFGFNACFVFDSFGCFSFEGFTFYSGNNGFSCGCNTSGFSFSFSKCTSF